MKTCYFTLLCLLFGISLVAQDYRPHHFKLDLNALRQNTYGLAWEWRFDAAQSLEVSGAFTRHQRIDGIPADGQTSQLISQYELDTLRFEGRPYPQDVPVRRYSDGARPLPALPVFMPIQTWQFRVGYRYGQEMHCSRWRWFAQPGLSLSKHDYRQSSDRTELLDTRQSTETSGLEQFPTIIRTTTFDSKQTQVVESRQAWLLGLRYDAGLSLRITRSLHLEARASGLLHFKAPYANAPAPVRQFQVQGLLQLVWALGRMRWDNEG